jgi:hypothetical protein
MTFTYSLILHAFIVTVLGMDGEKERDPGRGEAQSIRNGERERHEETQRSMWFMHDIGWYASGVARSHRESNRNRTLISSGSRT